MYIYNIILLKNKKNTLPEILYKILNKYFYLNNRFPHSNRLTDMVKTLSFKNFIKVLCYTSIIDERRMLKE